MKYEISFTPEGEIVVHTDDAAQVAALVKEMRNGTKPERKAKQKPREPTEPDVHLTALLTVTWNWLVANDRRGGITAEQMSEAMGINKSTAVWRLNELAGKGVAYRVKRGYFRPGEGKLRQQAALPAAPETPTESEAT